MQSHHSTEFVSPKFQKILEQHDLSSFEQLWRYKGEWFEEPNKKRGGWSGVNYLVLSDEDGHQHGFYLKRQAQYLRKTWRHPIQGEPTFAREFKILKYLMPSKVATPTLVYFAQNNDQCILMTAALSGYQSADQWIENNKSSKPRLKKGAISAMAQAVSKRQTIKL